MATVPHYDNTFISPFISKELDYVWHMSLSVAYWRIQAEMHEEIARTLDPLTYPQRLSRHEAKARKYRQKIDAVTRQMHEALTDPPDVDQVWNPSADEVFETMKPSSV